MMVNKNGFDEMQRERRGNIGNQMFMLLLYALLIDSGLYGLGVRWIDYPGNVMVLVTICGGIYIARLIAANAYLPQMMPTKRIFKLSVITLVICVAVTSFLSYLIAGTSLFGQTAFSSMDDGNSAIMMTVASVVGLLTVAVVAVIRKVNNGRDDSDD